MTRPTALWLTPEQASRLTYGTAVTVELPSHRGPRLRGRLHAVIGGDLTFVTCGPDREVTVPASSIKRVRVAPSVLDEGDAVLRRGLSLDDWRGGVVETRGTRVLVETLDGTDWHDEAELLRADLALARRLPAARTGRIARDRSADLAREAAGGAL